MTQKKAFWCICRRKIIFSDGKYKTIISKFSLYTGLLMFLLFPYRNATIAICKYLQLFLFIDIKY